MKKRTLISTLAMVVIVALALTTATFAWYTANDSVEGSGTAVSATASSANLAIGTSPDPSDSAAIDLSSSTTLIPMAPKTDWSMAEGSETTYGTASTDLYSSSIEAGANAKFTSTPTTASTPITGKFYVKNLSAGTKVDVTISLGTTAKEDAEFDGSNLLRVAIFVGNGNDAKYVGLLGIKSGENDPVTKYGTIDTDTVASTLSNTTVVAASSLAGFATLGENGTNDAEIEINYIAWFDGALLTSDNQGAGCGFTLTVTGSEHTGD